MSSSDGPGPVGKYRLLHDFRSADASIRVIEMTEGGEGIDSHVHLRSNQSYLVISGAVVVELNGVEQVLHPYQVINLPVGDLHSARPLEGTAVVANISVPPLAADDQLARPPAVHRSDLELPTIGSDFDD